MNRAIVSGSGEGGMGWRSARAASAGVPGAAEACVARPSRSREQADDTRRQRAGHGKKVGGLTH